MAFTCRTIFQTVSRVLTWPDRPNQRGAIVVLKCLANGLGTVIVILYRERALGLQMNTLLYVGHKQPGYICFLCPKRIESVRRMAYQCVPNNRSSTNFDRLLVILTTNANRKIILERAARQTPMPLHPEARTNPAGSDDSDSK